MKICQDVLGDDPALVEDDPYGIVSRASFFDERMRVLNEGHTFGLFNEFGDVRPEDGGAFGLYHAGTRFVSEFTLKLGGRPLMLLSSRIKEGNEVLSVDLTNQDYIDGDGRIILGRGAVHLLRTKFVRQGACYETIEIHNHECDSLTLTLNVIFRSDFADIFEVRGIRREKRGQVRQLVSNEAGDKFHIEYLGLDGARRVAELGISMPGRVSERNAHQIDLGLSVPAKERAVVRLEIRCYVDDEILTAPIDFLSAREGLDEIMLRKRGQLAKVRTNNEHFNRWIERSEADLASLLAETSSGLYPYAGVPWYNTPFGRDGLITALQTLWLAPEIAAGVLRFAADSQAREFSPERDAEPGKIFHEMRLGEMAATGEIPFARYYGTVDATPLFVILAGRYFRRTGDIDTIDMLWPNLVAAIEWMEKYGDADQDGYLEYAQKHPGGLHNQGWKDSCDSIFHDDGRMAEPPIALCEVQGYAYEAYRQASTLAVELDRSRDAREYNLRARELRRRFNRDFWMEDRGYFGLALDGEKKLCRVRTSNVGHCLYSAIVDPNKATRVVETLTSPVFFNGWGIRTVAADEPRYNPMSYHNGSIWPHDNSIIALGFDRYGFKDECVEVLGKLFDASLTFKDQRLPELYCGFRRRKGEGPTHYPVACSPQAWAVASVFACLQAILGLDIQAQRRVIRLTRPTLPPYLSSLYIKDLRVGDGVVDLEFARHTRDVGVVIDRRPLGWEIVIVK